MSNPRKKPTPTSATSLGAPRRPRRPGRLRQAFTIIPHEKTRSAAGRSTVRRCSEGFTSSLSRGAGPPPVRPPRASSGPWGPAVSRRSGGPAARWCETRWIPDAAGPIERLPIQQPKACAVSSPFLAPLPACVPDSRSPGHYSFLNRAWRMRAFSRRGGLRRDGLGDLGHQLHARGHQGRIGYLAVFMKEHAVLG